MAVLGIGGSGHDWSSCVMEGDVVVAIDEERLSRRKYGVGSDLLAAASRKRCLDSLGLGVGDLDAVVACDLVPRSFYHALRDQMTVINHHLAHAYSAFCASGFESSAVLVCDNAGSILEGIKVQRSPDRVVETISLFEAGPGGISLVDRVTGLHRLATRSESDYYQPGTTTNSLGELYRQASLALGLSHCALEGTHPVSEDGKTMGLASYGDDRFVDAVADLVQLLPGGQVSVDGTRLPAAFEALLVGQDFDARAALAAAVQHHLERALLHCVDELHRRTGQRNLCIAGGVGLNSVANGRILREGPFDRVYVFPAAGDNGISVGAAYYGRHVLGGEALGSLPALSDVYLGPPWDERDTDAAIAASGLTPEHGCDTIAAVADALADGSIVGWYDGGSEFGPRALGHRSILSSPLPANRRDYLNKVVKHREWFRPYAPVVPTSRASEYFDLDQPSPHMLIVADVLCPDVIPAVTHVDGTARVQTLDPDVNPALYGLLEAFEERTGHPVLLNTSFNQAGEPIVETPAEAIATFLSMELDLLVLSGRVLRKP